MSVERGFGGVKEKAHRLQKSLGQLPDGQMVSEFLDLDEQCHQFSISQFEEMDGN